MSASTRSKGQIFARRAGSISPDWAISEKSPRVFSVTVLPPVLGPEGALIRNITLFAVLIYELVGPMLTKMSLMKTGDIQPMSDEVRNRRQIRLAEKQGTK